MFFGSTSELFETAACTLWRNGVKINPSLTDASEDGARTGKRTILSALITRKYSCEEVGGWVGRGLGGG